MEWTAQVITILSPLAGESQKEVKWTFTETPYREGRGSHARLLGGFGRDRI